VDCVESFEIEHVVSSGAFCASSWMRLYFGWLEGLPDRFLVLTAVLRLRLHLWSLQLPSRMLECLLKSIL